MKFTDGYWSIRPGLTVLRPEDVDEVVAGPGSLTVYAPTKRILGRGGRVAVRGAALRAARGARRSRRVLVARADALPDGDRGHGDLDGTPMMRPMVVEFPDDPTCAFADRQYMLGSDLLVAPVMSADDVVTFYLPAGLWTHYLTGDTIDGGRWLTQTFGFDSLPLYVRPGAVIPVGAVDARPEYPWSDGVSLRVYQPADGMTTSVVVPGGPGSDATAEFVVTRTGDDVTAELVAGDAEGWRLEVVGSGAPVAAVERRATARLTARLPVPPG